MFLSELNQFSTCLIRCLTGKGFMFSPSTIPLLSNIDTRIPVNDLSCLIHCPVNYLGNNVLNQFFYVTVAFLTPDSSSLAKEKNGR